MLPLFCLLKSFILQDSGRNATFSQKCSQFLSLMASTHSSSGTQKAICLSASPPVPPHPPLHGRHCIFYCDA